MTRIRGKGTDLHLKNGMGTLWLEIDICSSSNRLICIEEINEVNQKYMQNQKQCLFLGNSFTLCT